MCPPLQGVPGPVVRIVECQIVQRELNVTCFILVQLIYKSKSRIPEQYSICSGILLSDIAFFCKIRLALKMTSDLTVVSCLLENFA